MGKRVLMLFVDGLGIGEADPSSNPFFRFPTRLFSEIFDGPPHTDNQFIRKGDLLLFPVDACLGVPGIPQSGTGQISIFCGINAPQIYGKHYGPYAPISLIPEIYEKNIFSVLLNGGKRPWFANAYPKPFFKYMHSGRKLKNVTAHCIDGAGLKFNKASAVWRREALTAELMNDRWRSRLGYKMPQITPSEAARRLIRIASRYDFTLFEYFYTDYMGHGREYLPLAEFMRVFDEFITGIILNLTNDTEFLMVSDHGNFENISIKSHTINPVMAVYKGSNSDKVFKQIKNLTDIKPFLTDTLL